MIHSYNTKRPDDWKPMNMDELMALIEKLYWDPKGAEIGYSTILNRIIATADTLEAALLVVESVAADMKRQLEMHFHSLKSESDLLNSNAATTSVN